MGAEDPAGVVVGDVRRLRPAAEELRVAQGLEVAGPLRLRYGRGDRRAASAACAKASAAAAGENRWFARSPARRAYRQAGSNRPPA